MPDGEAWKASPMEALLADLARARIGATFNQYADAGPDDVAGRVPAIRLANLRAYLRRAARRRHRRAGRGRRLPGHALVGDRLHVRARPAALGRPLPAELRRPRRWSEPSGTIVHRVLGELGAERRVILWNTVPTHPHRPGVPLSNRRPSVAEVAAGAEFAERLIALVRPATVVAVGRIAESVLGAVGHLRPPSRQRRGDGVCRGDAGYPRRAVSSAHSSE